MNFPPDVMMAAYAHSSVSWARDAETWRKDGLRDLALYAMRRHVELREKARALCASRKAP